MMQIGSDAHSDARREAQESRCCSIIHGKTFFCILNILRLDVSGISLNEKATSVHKRKEGNLCNLHS